MPTQNSPASSSVAGLAIRILDALPQTQCTRCGYPDCAAYADAVASTEADINQCPPGGAEGVERLAMITGRPALPLNPANGTEGPRSIAVIDENWCIGCTLCLDACPTDAILGGNKMMHTVIEPYCTGCELCIPVCPVDCISLENVTGEHSGWSAWSQVEADIARARYELHGLRDGPNGALMHEAALEAAYANRLESSRNLQEISDDDAATVAGKKRAVIDAALAQARAARNLKN